jgi:hypothetical protein
MRLRAQTREMETVKLQRQRGPIPATGNNIAITLLLGHGL